MKKVYVCLIDIKLYYTIIYEGHGWKLKCSLWLGGEESELKRKDCQK